MGAIAWWDGVGPFGSGGFGHVAYVERVAGGTVYLSDSRWNTGSSRWIVQRGSALWPDGFLHVKDAPSTETSDNPRGHFDKAGSPGVGKLRVAGWAFDPNAKRMPIGIHLYIGGKAGAKGAKGYNLGRASRIRRDVSRAFKGVGTRHGFDAVVKTGRSGRQTVCVYAINIGRGSNVLLGCKTVNVRAGEKSGPSPPGRGDSTGAYFPWDGSWHLSNALGAGPSNYAFKRGRDGIVPVVGDWDGDGRDSTGSYWPWDGTWHLRNSLSAGPSNYAFKRGRDGIVPVVGDWDGR